MAAAFGGRLRQITTKCIHSSVIKFKIRRPIGFHTSISLNVVGTEIKMPSLSPTMTEGTIVKWLKKEGETFQPGDVLCEIQTDKAVVAFEIEEEGTLAKILVNEDATNVKVGTLIGLMVAEGEDWKSVEMPEGAENQVKEDSPPAQAKEASAEKRLPQTGETHHVLQSIGPAVRGLLELFGLKASEVPATGPKGMLLKGDILKMVQDKNLKAKPPSTVPPPAAPKKAKAPSPAGPKPAVSKPIQIAADGSEFSDLPLSGMRVTIAKRLTESKTTIPHSYGTVECEIDKALALRKKLKSEDIAVSLNDFVIRSVAVALQQCPAVNSLWDGQKAVVAPDVDICVAVATDAGLITPIVKGAADLGLEEISKTVKELAERARLGKLKLHEFQGGSFTISNLGMFGIREFSAIINPPQCAILAVGSGQLSVGESGKISTKMSATLSYDRRAIAEDDAAEFLEFFRQTMEDPSRILLGRHDYFRNGVGA
ncbi:pyruvate dehydrogenase protein X component, mitochondrial-like [Ischnura elegans]|uniref:pyruvate dehydrogenase protein X component, mitochondrial-like n=1 Tax=Ischnura elegans TaxID=197161 RepID=UPI001ED8A0B6|nr:pyruvate dehydrogenase protein X component, mitochondrial-like [Ischnura elegans]